MSHALLKAGALCGTAAPAVGGHLYSTAGTYTFTVPAGITSICAVTIGSGAPGKNMDGGGSGGGLAYVNSISVTPGESLTVVIPSPSRTSPANCSLKRSTTSLCEASSGGVGSGAKGAPVTGTGGTAGYGASGGAGGGAGGYSGNGGNGDATGTSGSGGGGGGGGGWDMSVYGAGAGGGVGIYGSGSNGSGGSAHSGGSGGSSGTSGGAASGLNGGNGGAYGGGGGSSWGGTPGNGGAAACRIIWGTGRSFPSTDVTQNYGGVTEDLN